MLNNLLHFHRITGTNITTGSAFGAKVIDNGVLFVGISDYRGGRAVLGAKGAAVASVIDGVMDQIFALSSRTATVDVGLVLVAEMLQRREDRVRRRLAQPAKTSAAHCF